MKLHTRDQTALEMMGRELFQARTRYPGHLSGEPGRSGLLGFADCDTLSRKDLAVLAGTSGTLPSIADVVSFIERVEGWTTIPSDLFADFERVLTAARAHKTTEGG